MHIKPHGIAFPPDDGLKVCDSRLCESLASELWSGRIHCVTIHGDKDGVERRQKSRTARCERRAKTKGERGASETSIFGCERVFDAWDAGTTGIGIGEAWAPLSLVNTCTGIGFFDRLGDGTWASPRSRGIAIRLYIASRPAAPQ